VSAPLLQVQGLSVRFGGIVALDDVSFDVAPGRLTAVIGPNGAGKTTLFNVMSAIYRPTEGRVAFGEHDLTRLRPQKIARLGVARTFQAPALFGGMTVLENLLLGRYLHGRIGVIEGGLLTWRARREEARQREEAERVLELIDLQGERHTLVRDLPYGLQKLVDFGRALAQEPTLLLLDEPMAGMNVEEKVELAALISEAGNELGVTLLLVEHDMAVVMDLADHVVVLNFGKKIAEGEPAVIQNDEAVIGAYLGTASAEAQPVA
jgi:branched-chain amino acid transport system ATP-binding protein